MNKASPWTTGLLVLLLFFSSHFVKTEAHSSSLSKKQVIQQRVAWEIMANPALDLETVKHLASYQVENNQNIPAAISTKITHAIDQIVEDDTNKRYNGLSPKDKFSVLGKLSEIELYQLATLAGTAEYIEIPIILLSQLDKRTFYELGISGVEDAKKHFYFRKNDQTYARLFIHPLADAHYRKEILNELEIAFDAKFSFTSGDIKFHFTSSRSLILFEDPNYEDAVSVKLSLPNAIGPFRNKKIHLKEWNAWAKHNIYIADQLMGKKLDHFSFQYDVLGLGLKMDHFEEGWIFRKIDDSESATLLLPAFAVFHDQIGADIALKNGSNDPLGFWEQHLLHPLAKAMAEIFAYTGAKHTSPHTQNILIELDHNYKPTGKIVFRDADFYIHSDILDELNQTIEDTHGMSDYTFDERNIFGLRNGMSHLPKWMPPETYPIWIEEYYDVYAHHLSHLTQLPEDQFLVQDEKSNVVIESIDIMGTKRVSSFSDYRTTGSLHLYNARLNRSADLWKPLMSWFEQLKDERTRSVSFRFSNQFNDDLIVNSNPSLKAPNINPYPIHSDVISRKPIESWADLTRELHQAKNLDFLLVSTEALRRLTLSFSYAQRKELNGEIQKNWNIWRLDSKILETNSPLAVLKLVQLFEDLDPYWVSQLQIETLIRRLGPKHSHWNIREFIKFHEKAQWLETIISEIKTSDKSGILTEALQKADFVRVPYQSLMDAFAHRMNRTTDKKLRFQLGYALARFGAQDRVVKNFLVSHKGLFEKVDFNLILRRLGVDASTNVECQSLLSNAS